MARIDDIYEATEFLVDAIKDLANGRPDLAEEKIEMARIVLDPD